MAEQAQRPERQTREHILKDKMKVADAMARVPAKIIDGWRNNPNLKDCCRDVKPSELEFFDTDGNGQIDLLVMTCDVCGRKQRWFGAGGPTENPVAK